ncbi:hypothetical protein Acal01_02903 [Acinetobacter calcoaceticus]|uniref:CheW-like domain-containing protein n=1 Tax=Acinetobacter calcoaceticus DSM 30006 = CIP 81.8 TaxID=981331 RepID=A0ABP2UBU9_ACICA|nr:MULTISPECIES: hypothetical protein [Acinetobacter]ENU11203.1 hypothetical protein F997_00208 [Acinetobacter calcoaceticus NIPH 13]ENV96439.1 hypothetical protein F937_00139 [Acinetobacter calcoaceticus ANC 3680]ENV96936.1 hypothetical protein F936_03615 [Acinetobacter calcoaceticus DSM 30006 = CIP 81.8]KJH60580.1 hypothetical protein UF12_11610 [Acinetobacter calcoaceticus]MBJ9704530.1 hypothetical protein [Acinetobacter calcoaceticus]
MKSHISTSLINEMDQQELQHLITVSTGFIDAYIIECDQQVPMLLPQNIVLSAMDVKNGIKHIEWHDVKLPVYTVHNEIDSRAVALVIESEDISQRFALICKSMPVSVRLRISEVVDENEDIQDSLQHPTVFKYVRMENQRYHVPNLQYIQNSLHL